MKDKTGGLVHPHTVCTGSMWSPVTGMNELQYQEQPGALTLRDYFAAHVLTGYLAAHAGDGTSMPDKEHAAINAYDFADAMLKARMK